jgi:heptosyltransferase-2
MLRALKQQFPLAALDVLASPWNAEVFIGNPFIRRLHTSQQNWHARSRTTYSTAGEVLRLARTLRGERYDMAIDPRGDLFVILALWLAGIPRRVGWSCGGGGFLLTDVAPWSPDRHEIESRRTLLRQLGIEDKQLRPELFPSWADVGSVREGLATVAQPDSPLVVVHTSAGTAAKRWPAGHYVTLLDTLTRETSATAVLVGEASDQPQSRAIAQGAPRVVDWTGRLTLMQLAALLGESALFIGADSGPAHIAAAMGVPSVVLFSGTNRAECWRPVGRNVQVLQSPVSCSPCHLRHCPVAGHPCMTQISPQLVWETARRMLQLVECGHMPPLPFLEVEPHAA